MTPHGFSHIYELFATFTLAYIIVDELKENPFVRLITEKVLRKYTAINENFHEIKSRIEGHKESLKNIRLSDFKNETIEEGLLPTEAILSSIETRVNLNFHKIKARIRRNYSNKIFIFLNSFLFLYCLGMIYF